MGAGKEVESGKTGDFSAVFDRSALILSVSKVGKEEGDLLDENWSVDAMSFLFSALNRPFKPLSSSVNANLYVLSMYTVTYFC